MSSSKFKFLLDENVRIELYRFLQQESIDTKLTPKGLVNGKVAKLSLSEERILVTNDTDFIEYSASDVFAVILLRVPQEDSDGLTKGFADFLKREKEKLEGKLVILKKDDFEISSLCE